MRILLLSIALALPPPPSLASQEVDRPARAIACSPDGRVERLDIRVEADTFQLWRRDVHGVARPHGETVRGVFNHRAGLHTSDPSAPVAGTYTDAAGQPGVVIWFEHGTQVFPGMLVASDTNSRGEAAVVVRVLPGPFAPEAAAQARDIVFSRSAEQLADRVLAWIEEPASRPTFSVDGGVIHEKSDTGMAVDTRVELRDAASLALLGTIAMGGEIITDVLVLDRATAFFTASGSVFQSHKGTVIPAGIPDARVHHERLYVDPTHQRILATGAGGFQTMDVHGAALHLELRDRRLVPFKGFTRDGLVWESPVWEGTSLRSARALDPLDGTAKFFLPAGDPALTREGLGCVWAMHWFHLDDTGGISDTALQRIDPAQ